MNVEKYRQYKTTTVCNFYHQLNSRAANRLTEFTQWLKEGKNFSIIKYGDGEFLNMISTNEAEQNCDGNNYFRSLGDDLIRSYIYFIQKPDVYICKWHSHVYELQDVIDKEYNVDYDTKFLFYDIIIHKVPFTNEQVNFFKGIQSSKRKKLYVSQSARTQVLRPVLNIDNSVDIPSVNCYLDKDNIVQRIRQSITEDNMIIMFSAGMASKVLIAEVHETHPNNTFIDIGSTFDGLICGSRDYNCGRTYRELLFNTYKQ